MGSKANGKIRIGVQVSHWFPVKSRGMCSSRYYDNGWDKDKFYLIAHEFFDNMLDNRVMVICDEKRNVYEKIEDVPFGTTVALFRSDGFSY